MKLKYFQIITLLLCATSLGFAKEEFEDNLSEQDDLDLTGDEDLLREIEEMSNHKDLARENERAAEIAADFASQMIGENHAPVEVNPCEKIHCGAGRVCEANGNSATCICIPECPDQSDPRRMVCTNRNETWNSDCEVYRERCLCDTDDALCKAEDLKHIHINYYGQCKEMPICSEEEMSDFPRRMRDWLFNVMNDLAQNEEFPQQYKTLQEEAETNLTRRWTNAAIWKWCDLDGHPHDRSVSIHELFPIRAPLMALEHCIAPFLELCDPDDDHRITLQEWGKCLQLDEGDMEYRCEEIGKANE